MKTNKLKPVSKKTKMKMVYGEGGSILNTIGTGLEMAAPLAAATPLGPLGPIAATMLGGVLKGVGSGSTDNHSARDTSVGVNQMVMQGGGKIEPYVTSDVNEYNRRKGLYNDSLNLHNKSKAFYMSGVTTDLASSIKNWENYQSRKDLTPEQKAKFKKPTIDNYSKYSENSDRFQKLSPNDQMYKKKLHNAPGWDGTKYFNEQTGGDEYPVYVQDPNLIKNWKNPIKPTGYFGMEGGIGNAFYKKPVQKVILEKPSVTPEAQTQINTGNQTPVTLGMSSPDSSTGKRLYRLGDKNISEQEFNKYKTLGKHKIVEYKEGGPIGEDSPVAESTGTRKYIDKKQPVGLANFDPLTQVQRDFNKDSFSQNPVNRIKEDPKMGKDAAARYEIGDSTIYTHPGKLPKNAEDSLSYNIAETPHAKQLKDMGQARMIARLLMDNWEFPNKADEYNNPGTIEHEAHSEIGEDMKYEYLNKIIDYNSGTGRLNGKHINIDSEAERIQLGGNSFIPTNNLFPQKKAAGGSIGGVQINAEQNELIIDPKNNKVKMDLRNLPPHPQDPNMINPNGTLNLPEDFKGDIVIPKNGKDGREAFLKAKKNNDKFALNRIKRNLTNKQEIKAAEEAAANLDMYKEGGKVYLRQPKKMEDGGQADYFDNEYPYRYPYNPHLDGVQITEPGPNYMLGDAYTNARSGNDASNTSRPIPPITTKTGSWRNTANQNIRTTMSNTPSMDYSNQGNSYNREFGGTPAAGDNLSSPSENRGLDFLTNNAGNLYQLGNAIFNQEKTNPINNRYEQQAYDAMKGRRYNIKPELDANNSSMANANYALRNSGSQNGSEVRSRLTDVLRSKFTADSRAFATKQNADNQYLGEEAQFRNAQGEMNRNEGIRVQTANEQNRARRQDMIGSSLSSMGRNLNMSENDKMRINLLPQLFPGLGQDGQDILMQLLGKQNNGY